MARKLLAIFLSIILLTCPFFDSPKVVLAATFPNGGFENFPAGGSNDWTWPAGNWEWDASSVHSGAHSARVSRSSGLDTSSLWSAYVSLQPSTEYTLSYWLRTSNASWYPRVVLYQYTSSDTQTGTYLVAYANIGSGTNGWKVVNYRFQSMPNAVKLRVRIYLDIDTTGTFWFDDFSLSQGALAKYPYQAGFPVLASGQVWLPSPVVADINNDGDKELLIGAGSAINGWDKTGIRLANYPIPTNDFSIVGQIALADLDHDGRMEIAAGTRAATSEGRCRVFVWNDDGSILPNWPQYVDWNTQYSNSNCWITSVVLADVEGDQNLEILASTTNNGAGNPQANLQTPNLYAWHIDGSLVAGNWPNQQTTAGIYGALAAGDLNSDGKDDVVVGRDYLYLNAYGSNGLSLPGWPIRTFVDRNNGNYDTEQRIEYSVNGPVIADLDGDGTKETIVAGHVSGPGNNNEIFNNALLVLEPDGTRRAGWETAALGSGILAQADLPWQAPAVADHNGDGQLEIVVATEDGWIRAYQADKQLLWSFNYAQGAMLFATDPVIGDIDGDESFEILFGTYVPAIMESDKDGPVGLWALKANGAVVTGFPLIVPTPGIRSAPTLADLDGDGKLDILAATRSGQVIVWDTNTEFNAFSLPWPTGRHDLRRSATYSPLNPLEASFKSSSKRIVKQNDTLTFTIHIASSIPSETISLSDTIPAGISYVPDSLHCTCPSGVASENGGVIQWNGTITNTYPVEITYDVTVKTSVVGVISNTAILDTSAYGLLRRTATIYANFLSVFLPVVKL